MRGCTLIRESVGAQQTSTSGVILVGNNHTVNVLTKDAPIQEKKETDLVSNAILPHIPHVSSTVGDLECIQLVSHRFSPVTTRTSHQVICRECPIQAPHSTNFGATRQSR